jgi:hypothetical protein
MAEGPEITERFSMPSPITKYEIKIEHPWQNGPAELIGQALDHLHANTDFDLRIAFLLLDVGVETLFKTYLTIPDKVTGIKGAFTKRKKAAEGTLPHKPTQEPEPIITMDTDPKFHDLVMAVSELVPDQTIKLKYDWSHIEFYHGLRNKLYHQGNGITVTPEQVKGYAVLAVDLLKDLLKVDLLDVLRLPEIEREKQSVRAKKLQEIEEQKKKILSLRTQLNEIAAVAVERFLPLLSSRSFWYQYEKNYSQNVNKSNKYFVDEVNNAVEDEPIRNWLLNYATQNDSMFGDNFIKKRDLDIDLLTHVIPLSRDQNSAIYLVGFYPLRSLIDGERYILSDDDIVEIPPNLDKALLDGQEIEEKLNEVIGIVENWVQQYS